MQRRRTILVVIVAGAVYVYAWGVQPNRPQLASVRSEPRTTFIVSETGFVAPPEHTDATTVQALRLGWYGMWYDQYHYAQMARTLARFDLPGVGWAEYEGRPEVGQSFRTERAAYAYGLGYPLLAVPFVWLGFGGDPYVVVNGLLFALSAALALRVARRFVGEPAAVVAVLALVTATPFVRYFVIPFGTSITVVAVLASMWLLVAPRISNIDIALAAGAIALCAAARYVDAVWPVLFVVAAVATGRPHSKKSAVASAITLSVAVLLVAWSHDLAFGSPWKTPYHFHNGGTDISARAYDLRRIPTSFVGVFITGQRKDLFGVDPILRAAPWMLLTPVGLWALFKDHHPLKRHAAIAAGIAAVATIQYCAWLFGGVENLRLWNIRFYHSWFPLYCILSAAALERWLKGTTHGPSPADAPPQAIVSPSA